MSPDRRAARWQKLKTFAGCGTVGVVLICTAYLLPRQPGLEIPVFLFVVGLIFCVAGLIHGLGVIPSILIPHAWLADDGADGHGHCGDAGGGDGDGACGH